MVPKHNVNNWAISQMDLAEQPMTPTAVLQATGLCFNKCPITLQGCLLFKGTQLYNGGIGKKHWGLRRSMVDGDYWLGGPHMQSKWEPKTGTFHSTHRKQQELVERECEIFSAFGLLSCLEGWRWRRSGTFSLSLQKQHDFCFPIINCHREPKFSLEVAACPQR